MVAEGNGYSAGTGTARAPDTMDIHFRNIGQFIIDHHRQVVHVDSPCGDVGSHQHTGNIALEIPECLHPHEHGFVAVKGLRLDTCPDKRMSHPVGTGFGAGEYQGVVGICFFQQVYQQGILIGLVDIIQRLFDGVGTGDLFGYIHLLRFYEDVAGELNRFRGHGGREENSLALGR